MNKSPLVTVYITTFNRPFLLKRALDSVLKQTYRNLEIIVVNDGDELLTELYLYLDINNVRYLKTKGSQGACVARNLAIKSATGDFITGLDDDDEFYPDRVEFFVQHYDDKYAFISSAWTRKPYDIKDYFRQLIRCKYGKINLKDMMDLNHVGNQIFVRKDRIQAIGGFDEKLAAWQDYDMWVRLLGEFGESFKFRASKQYIYEDDNLNRITNSPKKKLGMKRFLDKHKHLMSGKQYSRILTLIKNNSHL